MRKIVIALIGVFVFANSAPLAAQSALKGSRTAMKKQNHVAQDQDFTFLRNSSDVWRFVDKGLLVPVKGTASLKLSGVSFPYTRPAVKTFAQRLAGQYKSACGEKLVVTSLTRPLSRQPWNASDLSVHPAGMALDIRVPKARGCKSWLESTLVSLEKKGILEATKERSPAHYHVAVFPTAYSTYLSRLGSGEASKLAVAKAKGTTPKPATPVRIATAQKPTYASIVPMPKASAKPTTHKVKPGESLWTIARSNNVTVPALKKANGLSRSTIKPGQVLAIPQARSSEAD